MRKSKGKKLKKNKKDIVDWENKLEAIKDVLGMADKPLSYADIEQETGLSHEEVFRIISWYFSKITKETTESGFPHPDFFLFGDNIKEISENFGYKLVKSRLNVGETTKKFTRGYLR